VSVRRILLTLAVAALGVLLVAPLGRAQTTSPQTVFQRLLLNDKQTSPAIQNLLRRGSGFVDPAVTFTELTADNKSDAVVMVQSGGIAGVVGVYVFTSATKNGGNGTIRASLRLQSLRRASVTIGGGTIIVSTAAYAAGDGLCCPKEIVDMTYKWDKPSGTFKRTATNRRPGPKA
jgi:hypothetical protein